MGSKLDIKCRGDHDYVVIAALHHHPLPVRIPDWYVRPFYERVLGSYFDQTDELEDAGAFVAFVEERQFAAVLHGHKHIPRLDSTGRGIPVIGCGSSVGKVRTRDPGTFMSINLVTLNTSTRVLSARLLAERVAGGGLGQYKSHEIVWSPSVTPTYVVGS
jgi:3',5'-cyclic AMP phosphodiesterase CpdA